MIMTAQLYFHILVGIMQSTAILILLVIKMLRSVQAECMSLGRSGQKLLIMPYHLVIKFLIIIILYTMTMVCLIKITMVLLIQLQLFIRIMSQVIYQ